MELVRRGLVDSRSAARRAIEESRVRVGGVAVPRAATMVDAGTPVSLLDDRPEWASRAGLKLAAALEAFEVDCRGKTCLDVGASTGGFTDVLLAHGAKSVAAVDVGYGQMIWRLRTDDRVAVFDRTNFRHADVEALGAPFDVVTVDVSFISAGLLAGRLGEAGHPDTDYVVLIKPQFEAGKDRVGRGGVVTDPLVHRSAIESVTASLAAVGLGARHLVPSPIEGAKGNREFLAHYRVGPGEDLSGALDEVAVP